MFITIFSFFISFIAVFGFILVLFPVAQNIGLVDRPCNRKQHVGNIPLIGGLAIYTAITICSFVLTPFDSHYKIYLLSTSFMVLIGALDDYHDLDARLRLIAQFLIGSLMVFGTDLYITDLGTFFNNETIQLGAFGQIFTVLAVVTCINAFNMTDGVDGLVGAVSINTFLSIGAIAMLNSVTFDTSITSMLAGAVLAFLFFNLGIFKGGKYKIFMGDAGSMLMGLTVIWLLTYATSSEQAFMRPITAVWIIAIPLMDMFSVMIRRISAGNSPLKASRDHLHHYLVNQGFSNKMTTLLIGMMALALSIVGIISERKDISEGLMVVLFIGLFAIYHAFLSRKRTDSTKNNT
ncbi:UDP-N-acetylglucosamine--undecaprenyl-phosphate N-acetylglucosaminephosphotransferase [Paraglaciecola aquimarina]|uniref:Undecaprenyl-phosphate alpha-N-acetylglucosaminyl 1-phosphate transferase n=1 Tax=Paraglaciecola algarum TaxID=3050085 RepID=A0ABS9D8W1_9ALTE|nr:UDP-N-acetylglucosamine--undecaprenyl-phosphate N-acetylglucosaminephosphotransferase [Paraglaciecola sp. G1-23]MCF2948427.1 UDP-N-acetylglucosamine--undecaprenyl-phosphate N-acetylglucosaminephosphotransferase [Paraglaciecola sp. G1-23]